jgi:hypothetical protein
LLTIEISCFLLRSTIVATPMAAHQPGGPGERQSEFIGQSANRTCRTRDTCLILLPPHAKLATEQLARSSKAPSFIYSPINQQRPLYSPQTVPFFDGQHAPHE